MRLRSRIDLNCATLNHSPTLMWMLLLFGFVTLFGGDGEEEWGGRHPRKSGVAKGV